MAESHIVRLEPIGIEFEVDLDRYSEQLVAQPGAIIAPSFGDLAEGLARPSSPV